MAYDISFFENLVYKVFGDPIFFMLVMLSLISYYSMKYDIGFWTGASFVTIFGLWISWKVGATWLMAFILVLVAFFVGIQIMRRVNN